MTNFKRRLSLLKTIITTYLNRLLKEVMELVIKERNSNRVYATVPLLLTLNVNNSSVNHSLGQFSAWALLKLGIYHISTKYLSNAFNSLLAHLETVDVSPQRKGISKSSFPVSMLNKIYECK